MIRIFTANENDKIELSENELNQLLWEAYEEGVTQGKHEGKLEERLKNLSIEKEELERKKKSNTITVPNYPWDTTPIPTSPNPLPIYYTTDKDKEFDWNKITCTGTPLSKPTCITTCASSSNDKVEFNANPSDVFDINTTKKEKKKNGRK